MGHFLLTCDVYNMRLLACSQVFEEIPRHEHCGIMNSLAGLTSRWLAVTMGQLGQGGGHHIANRHKCVPLTDAYPQVVNLISQH